MNAPSPLPHNHRSLRQIALRFLIRIAVRVRVEGLEQQPPVVFFHPPTMSYALLLHVLLPPACLLAQGKPARHTYGTIRQGLMRLLGLRIQKPGSPVAGTSRPLFCPSPPDKKHSDQNTRSDIDGWLQQRLPYIAIMEKTPARWLPPKRARYTMRLHPASLTNHPFSPARYLTENIALKQQGRPRPLLRALIDSARQHGYRRTILCDPDNTLSYRAVLMRSALLARLIGRHTDEASIAILLPTSTALALSFLAIHWRRGTPVILNFTQGLTRNLYSCRQANVGTVISSRRFLQQAGLTEWLQPLQERGSVILLEDLVKERTGADTLSALCHALAPEWFWNRGTEISADEAAVILFTSGSEGEPKGVALSHSNLVANHAQISGRIDFQSHDVLFNCLPAFHSFGLGAGIVLPLLTGCRAQLYPSPVLYKSIVDQIHHHRATVFFSTDTFLRQYARHATPDHVSSLRLIFAGAEPLSKTTMDTWRETLGVDILQGYGVTETSPVVSFNYPGIHQEMSVGLPVAGMEYKIQPVPGVEHGGRLLLRGPNVMLGYLTEGTSGQLSRPPDGWHDTGDIVEFNPQGFLFIHGRLKRFIKTGGEMVPLDLIDKLVSRLWPEHQHAVVGVADEAYGERILLATDHKGADLTELRRYIQSQGYPPLYNPAYLLYKEELPVLATGKLDYPAIQKIANAVPEKGRHLQPDNAMRTDT